MMDTDQLYQDLDQGPAIIPAFSSITQQQACIITQAVADCGSAWTVQTLDDYDGYLSVLIEPVGDLGRLAYYISGRYSRIELAVASHDDLSTIARFTGTSELVNQLATLLCG